MNKDYRVEVRIKNNLLYSAIMEDSKSVAEFCRKYNLSAQRVGSLINMHAKTIYKQDGETLHAYVQVLCDILQKSPCELFPEQYYLEQNNFAITANKNDLTSLSYNREALMIANNDSPLNDTINEELKNNVSKVLSTLSPREERIMRLRYIQDMTKSETARIMQISSTRASQIEEKALRKLKHPSRSRNLRGYLEYFDELAA